MIAVSGPYVYAINATGSYFLLGFLNSTSGRVSISDNGINVYIVDGSYRYNRPFPSYALGDDNRETAIDELMNEPVRRVVVLSPEHNVDEFLGVISKIGLHSVSYAIGYTAWLDIAPQGISKASALEKQRAELGILPHQVIALGDGRNEIGRAHV